MLLHLLGLSINIAPVKRKLPTYPQHAHSVDVFIPTYDEDVSVSYIMALACKNFKCPSITVNVFILNDGSRLDRLNNPQRNVADKNTISTYSITFWIFLFLFIIGLGRAFWIYHDYPLFREAVYLTSFWNIFNLIIVICCIGALHEQKQPEKYYSFPVFNEYIQHKNQKLKIKRLSLSTILVELKGRFKPKTGEK